MTGAPRRSLLVPGLLLGALTVATFVASFGAFLMGRIEASRVSSPDGAFVAVTSFRRYEGLLPRGPGSGGDKAGALEVLRADGSSCGRVELPMVSLARDLRWDLGSTPRTATIIGAAVWNLDACSVDTSGW